MLTVDVSLSNIFIGHQNPIFAVSHGLDASTIFTGGNDKGVVEWDMREVKFNLILCAIPASVYVLHLLEEERVLIIGLRNGEVWFVDIARQELIHKTQTAKGAVFDLRVFSDKRE